MPLKSRRLAPAVAILVSILSAFAGCMSDPVTGPEVRPRLVLPPTRVSFYSPPESFVAPATGDMIVRWARSPADTQLNFKGYFVKVWTTHTGYDSAQKQLTTQWFKAVDSAHVKHIPGQLDTSYRFKNLPLGEYTAVVYGEKATDTLGYSADSTLSTNHIFDPRPLLNPSFIEATSIADNVVRLHWKAAATDTNIGWMGDSVFYLDTNRFDGKIDSAHQVAGVLVEYDSTDLTLRSAKVTVPNQPASSFAQGEPLEHPYRFWVMSCRKDGVYFHTDSATISWAGAPRLGSLSAIDTSKDTTKHQQNSNLHSFRKTIAIDHNQAGFYIADSDYNNAEALIAVSNGVVTLCAANGAKFLDNRIDEANSLDDIYYSKPLADVSQFNTSQVTLPAMTTSPGVIVYIMMTHDILGNKGPGLQQEWLRIFVQRQSDGSFIDANDGINILVSFQPGVDNAGSRHLPYY